MTDFRCKCGKLLLRYKGNAEIEVKCPKCKQLNKKVEAREAL